METRLLKITVIGKHKVGKSTILDRYVDNKFIADIIQTIGVDFKIKQLNHNGHEVKMTIWDTAGAERFRSISYSYYRGTSGFLMVFSLIHKRTFDELEYWVQKAREISGESVPIILVGNKADLIKDRVVTKEECLKKAEMLKAPYIEVSAKTGENIPEIFSILLNLIIPEQKNNPVHKIVEKISTKEVIAPDILEKASENEILDLSQEIYEDYESFLLQKLELISELVKEEEKNGNSFLIDSVKKILLALPDQQVEVKLDGSVEITQSVPILILEHLMNFHVL